jgi:ankyrin repeat protein
MKPTTIFCAIAILLLVAAVGHRRPNPYDLTPDDELVCAEDVPAMQAALAAGASLQANPDGFTPLSNCVVRNFVPGIELLLERGADPDGAPNSRPLILAASAGNLKITRLLLQHGANPNITNQRGQTTLQLLADRPDANPQVLRALLEAGAHRPNDGSSFHAAGVTG